MGKTYDEMKRSLEDIKQRVLGMDAMVDSKEAHQTADDITSAIDDALECSQKDLDPTDKEYLKYSQENLGPMDKEYLLKLHTWGLFMSLGQMRPTRRDFESLMMIKQTRKALIDTEIFKHESMIIKERSPLDKARPSREPIGQDVGVMTPELMEKLGVKPGDVYNGTKILEPTPERMAMLEQLREQPELDIIDSVPRDDTDMVIRQFDLNALAVEKGLAADGDSEAYDGPDFDG